MSSQGRYDEDQTVINPLGDLADPPAKAPPFKAVSGTPASGPDEVYIAQQSSLEQFVQGLNPLVDAAVPLLVEIIRLRLGGGEDVNSLKSCLESEAQAFEVKALASVSDRSQVLAARYVLCIAIDESVAMSAIDGSGEWFRQALLSTFHNETWGGEKSFQLLERRMQQPAHSLYLLELIYALISLGFEGRYRVMDRGTLALESLRDKVYRQIRMLRGDPRLELAKSIECPKSINRIHRYVPLWLVAVLAVAGLTISFWSFSFALNSRVQHIYHQYGQIPASSAARPAAPPETSPAPAAPVQPTEDAPKPKTSSGSAAEPPVQPESAPVSPAEAPAPAAASSVTPAGSSAQPN